MEFLIGVIFSQPVEVLLRIANIYGMIYGLMIWLKR